MTRLRFARAGERLGRAILRTLLCLLGANLLCFVLLFMLYSPGEPHGGIEVQPTPAGVKGTPAAENAPLLINLAASGTGRFTETRLFDRTVRVLGGDFGEDARGREIVDELVTRIGPSAALVGVPAALFALAALATALGFILIAAHGNAGIGMTGLLVMTLVGAGAVLGGYVALGQLFAWLQGVGFGPGRLIDAGRPLVAVTAASGGLALALWWRHVAFLPALMAGPASAARARGLPELKVCLRHGAMCALPAVRALVPGLISFLFMLSLMFETLFEVPGLGQYAVEGFHAGDVLALHSVILLGVALHLVGLNLAELALAPFDRTEVR